MKSILLIAIAAVTLAGCVVAPAPVRGGDPYYRGPQVYVPPPTIYVEPRPVYVPPPAIVVEPRPWGYGGHHRHGHHRGHRY